MAVMRGSVLNRSMYSVSTSIPSSVNPNTIQPSTQTPYIWKLSNSIHPSINTIHQSVEIQVTLSGKRSIVARYTRRWKSNMAIIWCLVLNWSLYGVTTSIHCTVNLNTIRPLIQTLYNCTIPSINTIHQSVEIQVTLSGKRSIVARYTRRWKSNMAIMSCVVSNWYISMHHVGPLHPAPSIQTPYKHRHKHLTFEHKTQHHPSIH